MAYGPFRPALTENTDPNDYLIGRGILRLAALNANDLPDEDGFFDVGNVPLIEFTPSTEFLEHFSSRSGLRSLDAKIPIEQKMDISFRLEEFNEKNGEMAFSGAAAAYTNASIAGFAEHIMITNVKLGRSYEIKSSTGQLAYGFNTADLLLEKDAAMDVPLVEGTDYTLDVQAGIVTFLLAAVNIADGDEVNATLTANPMAVATRKIDIQTETSLSFALLFVGENPRTGRKFKVYLHKVTIAADGAIGLITEGEVAQLSFTGAAERVESIDVNSPVGYIIALPEGAAT